MRKILTTFAVIALAGCVRAQPPEYGYKDRTGASRGQAMLDQSMAECEHQYAVLQAQMRVGFYGGFPPQPGRAVFDSCMSAKGWELMYVR